MHETQATRISDAAAWLLGYRTMRGHLDSNDELAPDVRIRARALLATTFGDAFRVLALTAVRDRNFDLARGFADGLADEFGRPRDARLVRSLATACERAAPVHLGLRGAYAALLGVRRLRTRDTKELVDRLRAPA